MLWLGQWFEIGDWASGSDIEKWAKKMGSALLRTHAASKHFERMRISVKCLVTLMVQYSFQTILQKYILRPFICKAKLHVWRFGSKDNSTGYIYYYVSLFFIEYYISAFYSILLFFYAARAQLYYIQLKKLYKSTQFPFRRFYIAGCFCRHWSRRIISKFPHWMRYLYPFPLYLYEIYFVSKYKSKSICYMVIKCYNCFWF